MLGVGGAELLEVDVRVLLVPLPPQLIEQITISNPSSNSRLPRLRGTPPISTSGKMGITIASHAGPLLCRAAAVPVLVLMVICTVIPPACAVAVGGENVQLVPAGKFPQVNVKSCPTAAPTGLKLSE